MEEVGARQFVFRLPLPHKRSMVVTTVLFVSQFCIFALLLSRLGNFSGPKDDLPGRTARPHRPVPRLLRVSNTAAQAPPPSADQAPGSRQAAVARLQAQKRKRVPGACWSRSEMPLLRQAFPRSPELHEALAEHAAMQEHCTSKFALGLLHLEPGHGAAQEVKGGCSYVLYDPPAGLGFSNRVLAYTSVFAWALLTHRAVLMSVEDPMASLLCNPFNSSAWMLPPQRFQSLLRKFSGVASGMDSQPSRRSLAATTRLLYNSSAHEGHFFCREFQDGLVAASSVAIVAADEYFLPALHFVPRFQNRLLELFPDNRAFLQLSRFLVAPTNSAWLRILQFYETHLAQHHLAVGIQVRSYGPSVPLVENTLKCTQDVAGVLPPSVPMVARELLDQGNYSLGTDTDIGVFVASMNGDYGDRLAHYYLHQGLPPPGHVVDISSWAWHGAPDMHQHMLAETVILSFCDELFTMDFSTTGYVAAGMAGVAPYSLALAGPPAQAPQGAAPRPVCQRVSSEPCFRKPPMKILDCKGFERRHWVHRVDPRIGRCDAINIGLTVHKHSSINSTTV